MYDYLLPIGSVVKVFGAEKLMMIFGVLQNSPLNEGRVFDYIAVPYPEGRYDPKFDLGFDQKDVEKVIFRGYEDPDGDRRSFVAMLDIAGAIKERAEKEKAEEAAKAQK